jgi:hypothetical protein
MRKLTTVCATGVCALAVAASAVAARPSHLPALTPVAHDALTRALAQGRLTEARYALERARSLFDLAGVRREFGVVAPPAARDATPILRDLAARFPLLGGADRAAARAILARPTDSSNPSEHHYRFNAIVATSCDADRPLCFHWDERASNRDAPPGADGNRSTIPPDVAETMTSFAGVYDLEVESYGYLPPRSDTTSAPENGGNGRTDIYLADLGGDRVALFGYCTTDDPQAFSPSYPFSDASAYCVVDEDFENFGSSQTPEEFRDITAAHEYFHAIQFAYDWLEDLWLMEGTAMLMEGQFRPGVEDRILYLGDSVLTSPATPVDRGADGFEYGAWIYWRFLVEEFGELDDPVVVREVWERAAGAGSDTDGAGPDTVANDLHSLLATRRVLISRSAPFRPLYAKFARVNRVPGRFYDEGSSYPSAPASRTLLLGNGETSGWSSTTLHHLASAYYVFKPSASAGSTAALRVAVNLPRLSYGSEASVIIRFLDGTVRMREIALDSAGQGARIVSFGRGTIRQVDLVLTNASTRMRCDRNTPYSCAGVGIDDLRRYGYRATVR